MLGRVLNNVKKASGQDWFISLTNMTLFTVFSKFWNGENTFWKVSVLIIIGFLNIFLLSRSGKKNRKISVEEVRIKPNRPMNKARFYQNR